MKKMTNMIEMIDTIEVTDMKEKTDMREVKDKIEGIDMIAVVDIQEVQAVQVLANRNKAKNLREDQAKEGWLQEKALEIKNQISIRQNHPEIVKYVLN